MKKVISVFLVLIVLSGMCACSITTSENNNQNINAQEEVYTIHCNDGTTKTMTAQEIVDIYNTDGRNFETLLKGALISGTGTVSSVGNIEAANWTYPDKIPCAWSQSIDIENGKVSISTFFAPKDNYVKLYSGDKVIFQGTLGVHMGVVHIGTHYQMEETYLSYVETTANLDNKYNVAIALLNAGKYTEAITVFEALADYKDSSIKIEECYIGIYGEDVWSKIKRVNIGDTYKLGTYEQDNNLSNGPEDIEWLVLSKKGTQILVTSKYGLDYKKFNTNTASATWETCSLRQWLNYDFINAAFTAGERLSIVTAMVSTDAIPGSINNSGNTTWDQIFLLSIDEVYEYFSSDSAMPCKPTNYAVANGVEFDGSNGNCWWWWLRTPAYYLEDHVAAVHASGGVSEDGIVVTHNFAAVRPAMWIDLSKIK